MQTKNDQQKVNKEKSAQKGANNKDNQKSGGAGKNKKNRSTSSYKHVDYERKRPQLTRDQNNQSQRKKGRKNKQDRSF